MSWISIEKVSYISTMLKIISVCLIMIGPLQAQYMYKELLFIPWGHGENQLNIKDVPGFKLGPTSFSVSQNKIYITDPIFQLRKTFIDNECVKKEPISESIRTKNRKNMSPLTVVRENNYTLSIIGNGLSFTITQSDIIGSGKYLGSNTNGLHYVYVETIIQQVPLDVKRMIGLYDENGATHAIFQIPNIDYSFIEVPFYVDEDGHLYIMSTREKGVTISGWIQVEGGIDDDSVYTLPPHLLEGVHYNTLPNHFPEPESNENEERESYNYPPVTREEALDMAEAYVSYEWVADAGNITGGPITDPNGVTVETPGWIQVGTNYHVPYQWGGFYTLDGFNNGIDNGKYAGDKATDCSTNWCVSSYAVGVDCSGFVSRCWNLSSHYSTAMMDDEITIAYDNWNDLGPGDAIHKVGHVQMVVLRNTDGSFLVVEASAADWKVSYRTYNLSQLTSYTPRYYVGMEGSPATIPRTDIRSILWTDSISIVWQAQDPESISGFHLYKHTIGSGWSLLNDIESSESTIQFSNENDNPLFFKMTSVSQVDSISESFSSDIYGTYQTDEYKDILIVDGFDRMNGSYALPYHNFAKRMGLALHPWGYSFDMLDNDAVIDGSVQLSQYTAVFWLLGDESTEHETFSVLEQNKVKNYLSEGGRLFVSGSEVAWDLDNMGSSTDRDFIHDYLKAGYGVDDANAYTVNGVEGTLFDGLTLHYDNGNHGVYEENYPDAFTSIGGSTPALMYSNGLIAATQFSGVVPGSQINARVVVMGFPFETIYNDQEKEALAGRLLAFFGFNVELGNDLNVSPNRFVLHPNFPNPFNPITTLRYDLPSDAFVTISIYDMLGREVIELVSIAQQAGFKSIKWDATDSFGKPVSAGVYLYQIQAGEFVQTKKMVLLK